VAHIQRSCGYALRPTLSVEEIGRAVEMIKAQDPTVLVLVDNCYGEFTEDREPCAVGAGGCRRVIRRRMGLKTAELLVYWYSLAQPLWPPAKLYRMYCYCNACCQDACLLAVTR
jgi:hypothetical protein